MFWIKIIAIPRGEAPFLIRMAWLGMVLPCVGYSYSAVGVLSGKPTDAGEKGYSVPQNEAVSLLAKKHSAAAQWWMEKGFPQPGHNFVFYEDEVEILGDDENKDAWG